MKRKTRIISILICITISLVMGCNSTPKSGKSEVSVKGTLSVKATDEGIEIKVPKVSLSNAIQLIRLNDKNEEDGYSISIQDITNPKVIDYFVDNDKAYSYTVVYEDKDWNEIYRINSNVVKAKGGIGELQFASYPKATYDSSTAKLVFETLPSLNTEIERFVGKGAILYNFYYRYFPEGGTHGKVGCGANFFVHSDGQMVTNAFANEGYEVEGKPMVLIDISGFELHNGNGKYIKCVSSDEMSGMPNPIYYHKVND